MSLNQEVDVLRNIPLFARMEPSKLRLLAFTSERVCFDEGEELFRQGDMGDAAYIILEGGAEVLIDTPQGEHMVAAVGRHEIVGEIAILIDVPRTATVRTTQELTALKINKGLFFQLVTEFPQIAVEVMRELAHRLEHTNAQLRTAVAKA